MIDFKTQIFECDKTKEPHLGADIYMVWYQGVLELENKKSVIIRNRFSLVSKKVFTKMPEIIDEDGKILSKGYETLRKMFLIDGTPAVKIASLMSPEPGVRGIFSLNEGQSFQTVIRRLMIPGFERIKDRLEIAKRLSEFSGFTEAELTSKRILDVFTRRLEEYDLLDSKHLF